MSSHETCQRKRLGLISVSRPATACAAALSSMILANFCAHFPFAVFLVLSRDGGTAVLNPAYKALIGSVIFPTREIAVSEHIGRLGDLHF